MPSLPWTVVRVMGCWRELAHGRADGLRDVEELEVREDLLALADEPVDELEVAAGREQLEADLVELDGLAQAEDHCAWPLRRSARRGRR